MVSELLTDPTLVLRAGELKRPGFPAKWGFEVSRRAGNVHPVLAATTRTATVLAKINRRMIKTPLRLNLSNGKFPNKSPENIVLIGWGLKPKARRKAGGRIAQTEYSRRPRQAAVAAATGPR